MHTVGPYRLLSALSSCEVGGAWSAVDEAGRAVTIAMLNTRASDDQRWRDAFAAAAQALADAEGDQLPIVAADHTAASPWVACAVERGPGAAQIFVALGQRLQSAAAPAPAEAPASQQPQRSPASAPHVPHQPGPADRNDPLPSGDRAGSVRSPGATAGPWDRPPAAATAAATAAAHRRSHRSSHRRSRSRTGVGCAVVRRTVVRTAGVRGTVTRRPAVGVPPAVFREAGPGAGQAARPACSSRRSPSRPLPPVPAPAVPSWPAGRPVIPLRHPPPPPTPR